MSKTTALGRSANYLYHSTEPNRDDLNDWGQQPDCEGEPSQSSGILLYKNQNASLETGLWRCTPGTWRLSIPRDEFCHFTSGKATYRSDQGQVIQVGAESCVLFPAGWAGTCEVHETLQNVYMLSDLEINLPSEAPMKSAKILNNPLAVTDVVDWGVIPTMIEGESKVSGVVLHKGENGESETGLWICTPGYWNCHVTSDEFCHFMEGRATYVHESGEVIEIEPNTAAFFPKDWKGTCRVHETIKKTYMIR